MKNFQEPMIRVMALHALAYCERLFYLEEVEEIRVADKAVYAGRVLHDDLQRAEEEEGGVFSSKELASPELGLVGKVDALRRRDGSLIPSEMQGKILHVVEPGARISRQGDRIRVLGKDGEISSLPVTEIGAVVLHGYPQITTQALSFCAYNQIGVHWVSFGGRYQAGLAAGAGAVQRKLRQYKALSEPSFCLDLAKKQSMAKVETGLRYILRASRGLDRKALALEPQLDTMRQALKGMPKADNLDSLRGFEGLAGRSYFACLPGLLPKAGPDMLPKGRNRRPPKDRFNALLSFCYALLYQRVLQAVLVVGLEPALGFSHQPRSAAHPLVLDLMELFRAPVCDMPIMGSVNRGKWDPDADFSVVQDRVWLSDIGRKKAIELFEKRLEHKWRHPVIGYSLSYARLIELEVRLLEKEWTGQPGLFARMRLR